MKIVRVVLLLLAGCSSLTYGQAPSEEEMLVLAAALTKVAAAAESSARYKNPPDELDEAGFLTFATSHDPSLLEPFARYKLRAVRAERRAVVLVCSEDGQYRLLEDAGCTAALDKHHWRDFGAPCEFSVQTGEICP